MNDLIKFAPDEEVTTQMSSGGGVGGGVDGCVFVMVVNMMMGLGVMGEIGEREISVVEVEHVIQIEYLIVTVVELDVCQLETVNGDVIVTVV